jgi:hypothetical protein
MQVPTGVDEVVGEGGVAERIAHRLLERFLSICNALHSRHRSVPPCHTQFSNQSRDIGDFLSGDRVGKGSREGGRAAFLVKPLIFAEHDHPDLPGSGRLPILTLAVRRVFVKMDVIKSSWMLCINLTFYLNHIF